MGKVPRDLELSLVHKVTRGNFFNIICSVEHRSQLIENSCKSGSFITLLSSCLNQFLFPESSFLANDRFYVNSLKLRFDLSLSIFYLFLWLVLRRDKRCARSSLLLMSKEVASVFKKPNSSSRIFNLRRVSNYKVSQINIVQRQIFFTVADLC